MTISPNQTIWGSYGGFEGPAYYGHVKLDLVGSDLLEKAFLVTSATEGALNSVNMYDSCICTVGAIQWCDRAPQLSVVAMLGTVADACGVDYVTNILADAMNLSGAVFKRNTNGQWRFFLDGGGTEVNSVALQQRLYLGGSGAKGSWTADQRTHAKTWCAGMASLWDDPAAQKAQVDFTKPKLRGFIFGGANVLFADGTPDDGWAGALKAAAISFAVNSPATVGRVIPGAIASSSYPKWSPEWCLDVLNKLTFSGIGIWPARYNAIRPVLETQFGITLPKNAQALSARPWATTPPLPVTPQPMPQTDPAPEPIVTPVVDDPMPVSVGPTGPVAVEVAAPMVEDSTTKITWFMHVLVLTLGFWGRILSEIMKLFK